MTINADGTAYQADRRAALEMTGILPSCPARSGEWREERENPTAARAYFENFEWAQLLLRTSRFDAAGIVISEAAAFGLPTLTNAVGGLATSVLHGQTGLVLPAGSPAADYCQAIRALMREPEQYQAFRVNARRRFDAELDWEKAGERLSKIIREAAREEI